MRRLRAFALAVVLAVCVAGVGASASSGHSSGGHSSGTKSSGTKTAKAPKPPKPKAAKEPKATAPKTSSTKHPANYCTTCARDSKGHILRGSAAKTAFWTVKLAPQMTTIARRSASSIVTRFCCGEGISTNARRAKTTKPGCVPVSWFRGFVVS